jgi:phage terminase Nu1 subunit (DNA packaging protein)
VDQINPMNTRKKSTYSLGDAARILGKKPETLRKWFSLGCPHTMIGSAYEIRIPEVFDWRIQHEKSLATGEDGAPVPSLELERAMLARSQREAVEMSNAVRRGELVDAAGVLREWQTLITACRSKLLSLGDKLAARLPIPDASRKKVAAMIREGVADALKEIAKEDA